MSGSRNCLPVENSPRIQWPFHVAVWLLHSLSQGQRGEGIRKEEKGEEEGKKRVPPPTLTLSNFSEAAKHHFTLLAC